MVIQSNHRQPVDIRRAGSWHQQTKIVLAVIAPVTVEPARHVEGRDFVRITNPVAVGVMPGEVSRGLPFASFADDPRARQEAVAVEAEEVGPVFAEAFEGEVFPARVVEDFRVGQAVRSDSVPDGLELPIGRVVVDAVAQESLATAEEVNVLRRFRIDGESAVSAQRVAPVSQQFAVRRPLSHSAWAGVFDHQETLASRLVASQGQTNGLQEGFRIVMPLTLSIRRAKSEVQLARRAETEHAIHPRVGDKEAARRIDREIARILQAGQRNWFVPSGGIEVAVLWQWRGPNRPAVFALFQEVKALVRRHERGRFNHGYAEDFLCGIAVQHAQYVDTFVRRFAVEVQFSVGMLADDLQFAALGDEEQRRSFLVGPIGRQTGDAALGQGHVAANYVVAAERFLVGAIKERWVEEHTPVHLCL